MSIYDFTAEEMAAIQQADAEIEDYYRRKKQAARGGGGDRSSKAFQERQKQARAGNPLWEYRMKFELTQRQMAKLLHVAQETVSAMERGKSRVSAYVMAWLTNHVEGPK